MSKTDNGSNITQRLSANRRIKTFAAVGGLLALLLLLASTRLGWADDLVLPWCKDVAAGKKVKLKINFGGIFIEVAEAHWTAYDDHNQSARGEFSADLRVEGQQIYYRFDVPSRGKHWEGTVPASRGSRCDECGGNNNGVLLVSSKFEAWPKRNDRTRIVLNVPDRWEVELDTDE